MIGTSPVREDDVPALDNVVVFSFLYPPQGALVNALRGLPSLVSGRASSFRGR